MTSSEERETVASPPSAELKPWIKPEVVAYRSVASSEAATINPGDALSSNS